MTPASARPNPDSWLSDWTLERLRGRIQRALGNVKAGRPTIVSVTETLAVEHDPSGIVLNAKTSADWFMVLDQPERDGRSLAMLGVAHQLHAAGAGRFEALQRGWDELCRRALADGPAGGGGSGLCGSVGFAFSERGATSEAWQGFPNAALTVPRVSLARDGGGCWLTVNVVVGDGCDPQSSLARVRADLAQVARAATVATARSGGAEAAQTVRFDRLDGEDGYREAVLAATRLIDGGQLEKVVLAREVGVEAANPERGFGVSGVFGSLRARFPGCFVYGVGHEAASFVGATPELLVRLEGHRASTVALAGSIARSADPEQDRRLGQALLSSQKDIHENRIVAQRITRALAPLAIWISQAERPQLVEVANIQHLCIPIRAQLRDEVGILKLVKELHPTPAVGGEPGPAAAAVIDRLERFDRGWYAGGLGWTDLNGDGELCVTLRCALLRGRQARCYAGAGIVADSDPATELAETETKLRAILPSLGAERQAP